MYAIPPVNVSVDPTSPLLRLQCISLSPDREVDCVNLSFDVSCPTDPGMEEANRQSLSPPHLVDS